jgi:prepilin-type N-terminal cleavage/methylation domain-containing protein
MRRGRVARTLWAAKRTLGAVHRFGHDVPSRSTRLRKVEDVRTRAGFTLLELLIVIAIIGIVGGIGFLNGRQIARGEREQGALATMQQSIWQGATAAASQGEVFDLIYDAGANELRLEDAAGNVERTFELPAGVTTNIAENSDDGLALRFQPPGKIELGSGETPPPGTLRALPETVTFTSGERSYTLDISVIGEVVAEEVP